MKIRLTAALGLSAALLLSACAANEGTTTPDTTDSAATADSSAVSTLEGTLAGKGSSAMNSAQTTWIAKFQDANPGMTVNYAPDGSGAGREAFMGAGVDFAGSDRAFTLEENVAGASSLCADDSIAYNLPIYVSPIAVIFNLEGVTELNLNPDTLAGIFNGSITKWNDPAIVATNEGVELPDMDITPVHRSDDSGTTENFTDYLNKTAPSVWTNEADGEWTYEGGEAAKGTSGVVAAVTGGTGTIGYADASQAGELSVAKIGDDNFYGPTAEDAAAAVDVSPMEEGREANDLAINLDRSAEGYGIVLVAYGMACAEYADPAKAELVKAYLGYVASEQGQLDAAEGAGSAPLAPALRDKVIAAIDSIK
ncbi:phosphate ABC transporter substrate-binding protein PstS [Tessaracoccus sp. MC1627]|uniref:phosphate ABC transporter substrate-binding protein PstS n=1 Tax=Tessaracoccus sp. MC1627 TaxID=2760312 RepID=UPI001600D40D|nr:phosphate ABC transporter substrate-binding protein PstS [Tessaracoccus sp. MC1627]MBB1512225.1 phosphate ABC transporter substrate-binding protein PstS [Tessaracoccus sp. MC1627]